MPDPALAAAAGLWSTVDPATGDNLSTRFLAMLEASEQKAVSRVDVFNNGTFLATLPTITAGSVTIDSTANVRRTCTLTLVSEGRELDDLVPVSAGDLLHPASGNELYVYRGFQYPDGSQDLCQLGVFRMSKPQIVDDGLSITITVTGSDRSAYISRIKWTGPYTVSANTDLATAVQNLIANRWQSAANPLVYKITPTNPIPNGYVGAGNYVSVPTTTFGTDLAGNNDPFADAVSLATDAGMELFFDPFGALVMQPILNDAVDNATTFDGLYEEGVTCTLVEASKTLDETATYNGVIATGTGTAGNGNLPPITPVKNQSVIFGATYDGIWNTDPNSPTYYDPSQPGNSLWGPTPYIYNTTSIPGYQSHSMIGTVTTGSSIITNVLSATSGAAGIPADLAVGSPINGDDAFIPSGTTIVAFDSVHNTITISNPATGTAGESTAIFLTGGGPPDTQLQAQQKINSVGAALLAKVLSILDETTFNAVPNPALWEDDVIAILRGRMGIDTTVVNTLIPTAYVVSGLTVPLDVATAMNVTCKPQAASQ